MNEERSLIPGGVEGFSARAWVSSLGAALDEGCGGGGGGGNGDLEDECEEIGERMLLSASIRSLYAAFSSSTSFKRSLCDCQQGPSRVYGRSYALAFSCSLCLYFSVILSF